MIARTWRAMPAFYGVDVHDTFVQGWRTDGADVVFEMDASIWPGHASYRTPPPSAWACYLRAHLVFPNASEIEGFNVRPEANNAPAVGESSDFGSIDALEEAWGGYFRISGEFGDVYLHSDQPFLEIVSDEPQRCSDSHRAYEEFALVAETATDGWVYGAITAYSADCRAAPLSACPPTGCLHGDGFVQAPDGSRAGVVWNVGDFEPTMVSTPEESRWGVCHVAFPRPIQTTEDLVLSFRSALPYFRAMHARHGGSST